MRDKPENSLQKISMSPLDTIIPVDILHRSLPSHKLSIRGLLDKIQYIYEFTDQPGDA
jgi:hypothetical protein